MYFDKEKDELMIELVKCYSAIYDKYHKEHKNYIYKHKCWDKISEMVGGVPVPECKKRWKSLRDQYNKKMKESSATGIPSNWDYINQMSFLSDDPLLQTRTLKTEVNSDIESECDNSQTTTPYIEVHIGSESEFDGNAENRNTEGYFDDTDDPTPGPSKKRKTRKIQKTLDTRDVQREKLEKWDTEIQETLDKHESRRLNLVGSSVNNTQKSSQAPPQSAIKKFFESMAEVVENFPVREQAIIRAKVCQLISDTEIRLSSA